MKLNIKIAAIMMTVILAILYFSVSSIAGDVGVPLVGLHWNVQPCTNILVPKELPQEFVEHADDLIIQYRNLEGYVMIVFTTNDGGFMITVWAVKECPAFITLDLFNRKTEESQYWVWDTTSDFREITGDQYTAILVALTPETVAAYCK